LYRQVAKSASDPALRDWARLHAAHIQFEQGQMDDAFFEMRRIGQESTDREVKLQAHLAMASIYLEKGRSDQALSLLKKEDASDLGPAWVASLAQARVAAWLAMADFDSAEAEWTRVLDGFGAQSEAAFQALLGLSEVARGRGEFEKAIGLAEQVLSSSPDRFYQAQALLGKGRALGGAGDAVAAREVYRVLMSAYPDQPEFIEAARQAQDEL
jgi:tetratricopeptide (TPR) repeat protein